MIKYRKRPIVVEAVQWTGANTAEILSFTNELATPIEDTDGKVDHFRISGLSGDQLASLYDYIVRGVQNELYPVKPDIFVATYEKVEPIEVPDRRRNTLAEKSLAERLALAADDAHLVLCMFREKHPDLYPSLVLRVQRELGSVVDEAEDAGLLPDTEE